MTTKSRSGASPARIPGTGRCWATSGSLTMTFGGSRSLQTACAQSPVALTTKSRSGASQCNRGSVIMQSGIAALQLCQRPIHFARNSTAGWRVENRRRTLSSSVPRRTTEGRPGLPRSRRVLRHRRLPHPRRAGFGRHGRVLVVSFLLPRHARLRQAGRHR